MNTQLPLSTLAQATLSSRQLHVWQAQQLSPLSPVFNVCCAIRLSGDLNESLLQQAFQALVARHVIVTAVVKNSDDTPVLAANMHSPLLTTQCSEEAISQYCQSSYEQVMDIEKQLFEIHHVRVEQDWVVVFKGHHLICDQWSLQLIVSDFLLCLSTWQNALNIEGTKCIVVIAEDSICAINFSGCL